MNGIKITAQAHSNIALIKYWGKFNDKLKIPNNHSISLTLDSMYTQTSVEYDASLDGDQVFLNGHPASEKAKTRVQQFMSLIRKRYDFQEFAVIHSHNSFPTAAGLASSASGFAALALAATKAHALHLSLRDLSILARQGSGSASRSIFGGFVEWQKGWSDDGSDSYAIQLLPESAWELGMVVLVLTSQEKAISSTLGMEETVKTSPYYKAWLNTVEQDLKLVRQALAQRDFTLLGTTMEHNALKMHASSLAAKPGILYWQPATVQLMHILWEIRKSGLECYFTIDAGPNIKVLVEKAQIETLKSRLSDINSIEQIITCLPGKSVHLIST